MVCCTNCFESSYLNAIIFGNKTTGNCNYCKSEGVNIYEASELNPFFLGIIDLYEIDKINGKPLESQIITDFHKKVFTQKLIDSGNVKQLIAEIIKDNTSDYQGVFDHPVRLRFHNTGAEKDFNQPLFHSWENFSKEIKTVNSSLYSQGYNIAIFRPEKFRCIESSVYDIENISLAYTKLNSNQDRGEAIFF